MLPVKFICCQFKHRRVAILHQMIDTFCTFFRFKINAGIFNISCQIRKKQFAKVDTSAAVGTPAICSKEPPTEIVPSYAIAVAPSGIAGAFNTDDSFGIPDTCGLIVVIILTYLYIL